MPRQPRLEMTGLPHHVVQRGVDRQAVFFDRECYLDYLHLLHAYAGHLEVNIHSWCLMTNHVHLLLTPHVPGGLSRLMQNLNRRYVQQINRRFGRTGHLWAGRFKASIVSHERYLLSCMRYIELNPVRAGMVPHPEAYPWSSWHANVGERRSMLVVPHAEYRALGATDLERQATYRALVLEHEEERVVTQLRAATQQNAAFGSPRFTREIGLMLGRDASIKPRGRPRKQKDT
ncbi:transposase [Stutzerimonas kunmingensis]|uniref:transposase n=1 Tax=Stutzerimonas kunmingensis TaxID=1211807 RepID=UPI00242F7A55|nr:transposase [Stutzerimonas kunmingensis]